ATLDELNDRQRAILQLLLKQDKSYDEIAELLKTNASSIQSRAHEAVSVLGPDSDDVDADRRNELADYLLGQQSASRRAATREYLDDSAAGREWARGVASALRPIAGDSLPEIPAEVAEVDEAFEALRRRNARKHDVARSSQLGTKLLFVGGGVVVAIVLILALGIFSSDDGGGPRTSTVTRTTPTETPAAVAEGVLRAPSGSSSKASGQMGIIFYDSSNTYKLLIAAKGLTPAPAGSAYGVWLYTDRNNLAFVGFPKGKVGKDGELQVVADLSPQTRTYREVLLTRERVEVPTKPGEIVLRGVLRVAQAATGTTTAPAATTPQTQTTP
ncbi:MAG: hypothetical protein QOJ89_1548, partial [bacterium]